MSNGAASAGPTTSVTLAAAVDLAIAEEMRRDARVFCLGTLPPAGLRSEFGTDRVRQMPISEAGFSGAAVGAAASGLRPVVFWRNVGFSFVAFDSIINQASKLGYLSGSQLALPLVFIASSGGRIRLAAQHSHSPHAIFAHIPGISVLVPSTPADAKGLVKAAIRSDEPAVVLLPAILEDVKGPVGDHEAVTQIGTAVVRRVGSDVTIVALGSMAPLALEAAEILAREGCSAEVIDLRSASPLDAAAVRMSVRRTGRLVVADEAPPMCSLSSEVAAAVAEDPAALSALVSPVHRVTALPLPVPYSPPLEDQVLPSTFDVVAAARAVMG